MNTMRVISRGPLLTTHDGRGDAARTHDGCHSSRAFSSGPCATRFIYDD